ncbi:MAG: hypothetical protein DMF72_20345 [Acidobacteria bacterium]|nr:MAG: hypothetical protein DMF72_20345 [Acidobacteriota bacterium]
MGRRIQVGDIVEIPTNRGFAYAQFVLKKDRWGALIRILPGLFDERPDKLCDLAPKKETFVTFFPLQAAVNKNIFEVVDNCDIPQQSSQFPLFRAAGHVDRQGKVHNWFLWDGERSWPVDRLTPELTRLPMRSVWNDTLLIERIEQGWTPETDRRTLESMS